jgi:transposase
MGKNRKAQSAAVRFGPALKAFVLCFLIGGSGVGYVWQKSQISKLGQQMKERERRLEGLRRENKMRADQLAALMSPVALDARVKKLNLGLVQPPLSQIVRITDALPQQPEQRDGRYAEQRANQAVQ